MTPDDVDVLIVGAGLSGIGAACTLATRCPGKRYTVLEGRARLGGTWDLFRYPGIRSDSDMFTFGYPFEPWTSADSLADGPAILRYLRATAETHGVERHIQYQKRVERASYASREARWTVAVRDLASGATEEVRCRFLFLCVGYYDPDEGYTPDFPGRERFKGRIVHPQHWSDDVAYAGRRVVVIGSGATAVTLVPALAKHAAHVTMLQRSPTYIVSVPGRDRVAAWLMRRLPARAAHAAARWKNVLVGTAFYQYCRRFPAHARASMVGAVAAALGGASDVADFTPRYAPWDERVCFVPDGDLFTAIRAGRASVVTDHVASFTETGLLLRSGRELAADLVVTATGLKLKIMGGIALEVDGARVAANEAMVYRGLMLSDVPNLAFAVGYTNASWTLKCSLGFEYVARLLDHMDRHGYEACCPRRRDPSIEERPLIDLTAGYVARAKGELPHQGSRAPWKLYQNYALDLLTMRYARLDDGVMEFARARVVGSPCASRGAAV